jgi:hypothetical protein
MSFDLKVINNDISFSSSGDVDIVQNTEKLIQDVLKIILTSQGSNQFYKWYGSTISQRVIGEVLGSYYTKVELTRSIQESLSNLIALQQQQSIYQSVSPQETLMAINYIDIEIDENDPRVYNIILSVLTKKMTALETTFQVRV